VESLGFATLDLGTNNSEPSDYPDFAAAIGQVILDRTAQRGILICGSGFGASVAANKVPGIRALFVSRPRPRARGLRARG
jgi:ribose 5-phosphate isomerase B